MKKLWMGTVHVPRTRAALSAVWKGVMRIGSQIRPPVKVREDIARITCGPAAAAPTHEKIFIRRFRTMNRQRKGILAGVATALIATMRTALSAVRKGVARKVSQILPAVKEGEDISRAMCGPAAAAPTHQKIYTRRFRTMNRQRKGILAGVATALIATMMVLAGCPDETPTTYNYICANGTPVSGTTTTENTERCQSCASGYTLSGTAGVDGTTCVKESTVRYTCENGTPVSGTPAGNSDVERCQSCASGYTLSGTAGADGTTCVADTAARYTCENGTPVDGTPSGTSNVEECKACTTGFALSAEKKCVQDSTAPTFTVGPAVKADSTGATSVTVTLTASEVGKIFWVLYTDGSAVADAAALINDATIDTAPTAVVARSATAQVESTTDAVEIALTGLTVSTPYDFYAVLQDSAGNNGVLSAKVEITTVDTARYTCENGTPVSGSPGGSSDVERCMSCASGYTLSGSAGADGTTCTDNPPTFSVAPMVDSSTETGATVTLTASEAGTLFWVLYADNAITTAPSAAALIAAASGSSVGEQRSGDTVTVDAANEKTVTLTGLAPGTTYDFYAVLQDSAGNNGAVSAKVEITTAAAATAKYTCENGTAKTGTPSGTSDVGACQSCATGYTLSGAAGVDGTTCMKEAVSNATCAANASATPSVKLVWGDADYGSTDCAAIELQDPAFAFFCRW